MQWLEIDRLNETLATALLNIEISGSPEFFLQNIITVSQVVTN